MAKPRFQIKASLFVLVANLIFVVSPLQAQQETFIVSPGTLKDRLLSSNIGVLNGLNQVYAAKLQVNAARAALLPSLNLGFGTQMSDPASFALSNVTFLLPFLLPSKWFELQKSLHMLAAEGQAFYSLELNLYASAESLYLTLEGDQRLFAIAKQQSDNYTKIKELLELKQKHLGNVNPSDLLQAQAQAAMGLHQVSQLQSLLNQEKAAIRQMLALPLTTDIQLIPAEVSSPDLAKFENQQALIDYAVKISPENSQLDSLIAAAKSEKWSRIFGFLSGGTLSAIATSTQPGSGKSLAFDKSTLSYNVGFGFGMFPAIQLAQNSLDQLNLRRQEIRLEHTFTVESSFGSLIETERQLGLATAAEQSFLRAYEVELERFNLGMSDYIRVLSAQNSWANASLAGVRAGVALSHLRISFHRLLLTDQFAEIPTCDLTKKSLKMGEKGFLRWLKDIVSKSSSQEVVDKVCRD